MATKKAAKKTSKKAPDTKASIKAANKALAAELAKGNSAAISKMYTKTAKLMAPNMDFVKGTKAIAGFWQAAIGMGVKGGALKTLEVEQHGPTAIEVGTYMLSGEGGAVLDEGKYIVVWKKEGGQWKLSRDIYNSSRQAT